MPGFWTVLFDLGGVVLNFDPGPRLAALSEDCGVAEEEILARIWNTDFDRLNDRGVYTPAEWHRLFGQTLGLKMELKPFVDLLMSSWSLNAPLLDVIDQIPYGVQKAAFTNNPPHVREGLPASFPEVISRLDPIIFSCDLRLAKPDTEAFEAALAVLGATAAEVVFIDDNKTNVAAAASVGMTALHYESPSQIGSALRLLGLQA